MKVDKNFNVKRDLKRKKTKNRKKIVSRIIFLISIFLFFVALGSWIFVNSQGFRDQITAWNNPLDENISKLADEAGINDRGKFLLQVSKAQVKDREDFNKSCSDDDETQSIILGCFSQNQIYIFNVDNEQVVDIKSIITAHEMLHAAYARLSVRDRENLEKMIRAEIPNIESQDIKDSLAIYEKTEPGEEINELHSLLATEEENLSDELEEYYERYFSDRQKVVDDYKKYTKVFSDISKKQDEISQNLKLLKSQIDSQKAAHDVDLSKLLTDIDDFNLCANTKNCFVSANDFDRQRNDLISRKNTLSELTEKINLQIAEYNNQVEELKELGITVDKINDSLDSRKSSLVERK